MGLFVSYLIIFILLYPNIVHALVVHTFGAIAPHGGENCPYIPTFVVFLFVGLWVYLDYRVIVIYASKVFESIVSTIIKEFICHIK